MTSTTPAIPKDSTAAISAAMTHLGIHRVCRAISAPRSAWKEQASCKERHRKDQTAVKSIPQRAWVGRVEKVGVEEVRKIKGYHDELLRGDRKGQRSIRLSKSYRAIYEIKNANSIEFISIEEVNKHEY